MSDSTIRVAAILFPVLTVTILGWAAVRCWKLRRLTHATIVVTGVLLILTFFTFGVFGNSLDRTQRAEWGKYFPEGSEVIAGVFILACYEGGRIIFFAVRRAAEKATGIKAETPVAKNHPY